MSGVVFENWVCGESDDVELKINVLRALVLTGRYPGIYFQIKAVNFFGTIDGQYAVFKRADLT